MKVEGGAPVKSVGVERGVGGVIVSFELPLWCRKCVELRRKRMKKK